jgi:hypothetical protein
MFSDELPRLLGMPVPISSAFESKHSVNRTCLITESFSIFVTPNVSIKLEYLYTGSDSMKLTECTDLTTALVYFRLCRAAKTW